MNSDKDRVIIVGTGVIGLCSAWHCLQAGKAVTLVERDSDNQDGCSFGNAGMVVPSHFIPLAAPGMISKGIKMLANPEGPFYIRPRLSMDLLRWCKIFMTHCTQKHVAMHRELLRDLNVESRKMFNAMAADVGSELTEKGLLMLCNTDKGLAEEAEVAAMANELGVTAEVCDSARIKELDPGITMNVKGGIWFKNDCHMDPASFMKGLRAKVIEMGAEIIRNTEITGLRKNSDGSVSLKGFDTAPD